MNIEMPRSRWTGAIVPRTQRVVLKTDGLLLANGAGEMELDLEDLSFWLPESVVGAAGDLADLTSFPAPSAPIFSPLPREYGSFLEAMELDFSLEDEESPPPLTPKPAATAEGGVSGCGEVWRRKRRAEKRATVEDELEGDPSINAGCKNLLSERNRRRRLNQQLLALRSLVPCISKMDKRSILMDAAAYIQNLHREIEEVKKEIAEQEGCHDQSPASSESNLTSSPDMSPPSHEEASSDHHHIFKIETDEMDDRTLSVKVVFGKARGAAAQVQRMIESLGTIVTNTWTHEMEGHQMITTSFISLKKQMNLTAEMLKEQMNKAALRMGFEIDLDD